MAVTESHEAEKGRQGQLHGGSKIVFCLDVATSLHKQSSSKTQRLLKLRILSDAFLDNLEALRSSSYFKYFLPILL